MKILLLGDSNSPHLSKWEKSISSFSQVECLTLDLQLFKATKISFLKIIRLGLLYLKSIYFLLKFKPDIVHAHYVSSYGLIGACLPSNKLVVSAWGSDILTWQSRSKSYFNILRFVLHRSKKVFADSDDLILNCKKIYPHTDKYTLVNWGIDLSKVKISQHNFQELRLISVRVFEELYNISTILDAFEIASKTSSRRITLEIYGKGSLRHEIEQRIQQSSFKNNIFLKGFKPLDEIYESLSNSNCFISIPSLDGTSSSLLEAMGAGLFTICSNLPSNREWVTPENGILIKEINTNELVKAIEKANLLSLEALKKIANANREIISRRANPAIEFDKVLLCYRSISLLP